MKVLLYINGYLPKIGGRELVVHNLAIQLQDIGHQVSVIGPGGYYKHRHENYGYPLVRWYRVPGIPIEASWRWHLIKTRYSSDFDLIHAHVTYPCGYMAAKMKRFLKAPLVITPHGNDINVSKELNHGLRLDKNLDAKIRYALAHADAITAISDEVKKSIQSAGVAPERITSIPNGVDINRFRKPGNLNIHDYLQLSPSKKLVVTVGNYHKRKGHEVLIEAITKARQSNPNLTLVIVGAKSPQLEKSLPAGSDEWLKFTGTIPLPNAGEEDILAQILQAADIYVSASVSDTAEGMSLAILEALAAGCRVVATNISGSADLLADGKYGSLVPPNNADALGQAIIKMLDQSDSVHQYKSQAHERSDAYGWRSITEQYVAVYDQLLL